MRTILFTLSLIVASLCVTTQASAHCQVPCGIYDDHARVHAMQEDAATIRKAVVKVQALSKAKKKNVNQVTRWIVTKEEHASRIIKTVSEYFLTQKIKPVPPKAPKNGSYLQKLTDHHRVMVWAMKNKQQLDLDTVGKLDKAIDAIGRYWTRPKK